jgi:hypothetical protein
MLGYLGEMIGPCPAITSDRYLIFIMFSYHNDSFLSVLDDSHNIIDL